MQGLYVLTHGIGGGFSQNVSWRWIFWINLPFIGIGTIMVILFLKLNYPVSSFWSKLKRVDWVGMALFLASFTGFLIPVTWGGVQYPWDSWRTLVPLLVCAAGIVVFIIHQEKFAPEPLIRTRVAKNTTAAVTFFQTAIHGVILWAILYFLPLYYEAVKGFSPILAGIALFPQTFTVAPSAIVVGILISVTGRYRWATWAGWTLLTLGMGILTLLKSNSTVPQWIFLNLIGGLGAGFLFPALAITVQACSSNVDQAHATSMFSFVRALGQTFGVAISGVVFQNQMKKKLLTYPLLADNAAEYSKDAAGLVQIIKALPDGEMKYQLRVSYTWALKYVWIVMTALSAVALVSSLFITGYPLDMALETEHGYKEKAKTTDAEEQKVES
jgi:MFS family permease